MDDRDREPGTRGRPAGALRRLAARLALVAASALLGLLLVEGLLWLVAPIPFHEWMVWEPEGHIRARPVPHQIIRTATGHAVRINRFGFRGPDWEPERAPGALRLVVFGGSSTFCYHAEGEEKTWPGALEGKLEARLAMPVDVINLGLPGFYSFMSKINYLCYGRMFEPNAVVVYHTWNDMLQFRRRERAYYESGTFVPRKPLWQRIARATQLGRRGRNLYWAIIDRTLEPRYAAAEGSGIDADRPPSPRAFAWERQNFEDFVLLARSDGVLPVLVSQATTVVPANADDPAIRRVCATAVDGARMTFPVLCEAWRGVSDLIADVAARKDAVFVDGYNAVPHDLDHLMDAVHLTDAGAEVLAETIATTLLADARFLEVVERVRTEGAPPQASASSASYTSR